MSNTTENQPASDELDRRIAGSIARRLDAQRGHARDAFMRSIASEPSSDPIPIPSAPMHRASRARWFVGGSVGIAAAAALTIAMILPVDRPATIPEVVTSRPSLPQVRHTIAWETHETSPVIVDDRWTARSFECERVDQFRWYDPTMQAHIEVIVPSRQVILTGWPTH
ncbi:MAG TPA: hypothetical protein PKB10_11345 [Tepidisphaeraceae bacterium]|nr:hypothetical protein [Tepidisphaeraceae bacterium]